MGIDQTSAESSWVERFGKAGRYLSRADVPGLWAEIQQFVAWKAGKAGRRAGAASQNPPAGASAPKAGGQDGDASEAAYWDRFDVDLGRKVSWGSPAPFGQWAIEKMTDGRYGDIFDIVLDAMKVPGGQPLRGLVLGCGDMLAEHSMFIDPRLPFAEVDAYDVSPQSMERAQALTDEKGLKVNYRVTDVNQLELQPDRYALVIVFHAYHHFERIEHVTQQINRALLPGGIFYTFDYVGPRRLQYSERQLFYAQKLLELFPPEYKRDMNRDVRQRVESARLEILSPDEAIRSDLILPAMARYLNVVWQYNWAGLLYPLLEGIAFNFTDSSHDQELLRFLFGLDHALCHAGEIEPNFTITLATKR